MTTFSQIPYVQDPPRGLTPEEAKSLFFNSYKCRQLYTLIDSGRSKPSLPWLSRKLDLQVEDVTVFLKVLLMLNLIHQTPDGYTSNPSALDEGSITKILPGEHAALTQDLLGDIQSHGSESLFFCVATDEQTRKDFMNQVKDLISRFCQRSKTSTKNLIYSVSLSTTKIKESKGDIS